MKLSELPMPSQPTVHGQVREQFFDTCRVPWCQRDTGGEDYCDVCEPGQQPPAPEEA